MIKHLHRQAHRTAQQAARLRADRARYQRDKPTPEQLLAEGGHDQFIRLGDLIALHNMVAALKNERARRKLTLAQISAKTGIDQAALSRLESGASTNPTLGTVFRVAHALGLEVVCSFRPAPVTFPDNKKPARRTKKLVRA